MNSDDTARTARVDRALRQHGDFGVYGDLRAGLAALSKDSKVTLTDDANGIRVDIVPKNGKGHEFQFVVTPAGTIENFMSGEAVPAYPIPQRLRFRFNSVQLVRQGKEMTLMLTIFPVWGDAQREPPEGFEDNIRIYRVSDDQFYPFMWRVMAIDFDRYVDLGDADFETTPPDMRHTEMLYYSVNGREIVSWGHSYARLKDAALRKPLLNMERQFNDWAAANPLAELPQFRRLVLRDVQGLHGGRNVYVDADGSVTVQMVTPTETGLHEKRYEFLLSPEQRQTMQALLEKHPLDKVHIGVRPGIPDQARPEITLHRSGGRTVTVAKWDDDRHPDFDALYAQLLGYADMAQRRKPVAEGNYASEWKPE